MFDKLNSNLKKNSGKSLRVNMLISASIIFSVSSVSAKDLRIGIDASWKPFGYVNESGELTGVDVDISKALCAQMPEYNCKLVSVPWKGMFAGLEAGKIDAIISGVAMTEERKAKYDFAGPYIISGMVFMTSKDSKIDGSVQSLEDSTIGTLGGTVYENYLRKNFSKPLKIKTYDNMDTAVMDLGIGRVDVVLGDEIVLRSSFINAQPEQYRMAGQVITATSYTGEGKGIVVRKGDDELRNKFNVALDKIENNGEYAKISNHYLGFTMRSKP